jgi:peptide/nickel transport system permease protein
MWKYTVRRMLIALPVLFVISALEFAFISLAPGDPIQAMLPPEVSADKGALEQRRIEYGLRDSLPARYVRWLGALARGNLGESFRTKEPTTHVIAETLPATLRLTVTALILSLLIGMPLGVWTALHERSVLDEVSTLFSYVFVSIPSFFLALLFIFFLAVQLPFFPATGMQSYDKQSDLWDALKHLALPALVLALLHVPGYHRYTRSAMLDVMRREYIRTARAKGLRERAITWRHVFPNALAPIVTIIGLSLPGLIAGSVLVEQVFAWPGMGTLSISAVLFRDYPVFMGTSLLYAVAVLVSSLLADLSYAFLDPRVRYG